MPTVREVPELIPSCPACGATLEEVHATALRPAGRGTFPWGKRYVYACPACGVALGVSHRKGFWAG